MTQRRDRSPVWTKNNLLKVEDIIGYAVLFIMLFLDNI